MSSSRLKLYIARHGENPISVVLPLHTPILDIKLYLTRAQDIPAMDLNLMYKFQVLADEKTVEEIGLVHRCTINLVPKNVFTVTIKTRDEDSIPLTVWPLCTVYEFKVHLNSLKNIPVENQNLVFNSQVLANNKTVEEIGLISGSIIHFVPTLPFDIFVITHTQESIGIKVERNSTIFDIKKQLRDLKKIPIYKQNLIFKYETLCNEASVRDIGLKSGSSLQLVLKMVDGFRTRIRTPVIQRNYISYITLLEVFRKGELILDRKVNRFYSVTSTSRDANTSLTKLVLSNLGLYSFMKIIFDKEDYVSGSNIRLTYYDNSKDYYEERVLKCAEDKKEPPQIIVEMMPCDSCGLNFEIIDIYSCECKENFCKNHKEAHTCKYHQLGRSGKRSN